jgi:hypothetical protein
MFTLRYELNVYIIQVNCSFKMIKGDKIYLAKVLY